MSWQSNWFGGPWSLLKTPAICYQKYSRLLLLCRITCREASLGHCMSCGFLCFNFLLVWGKYCFFLWILTTLHFFFFPAGILTHWLVHHWHTERLMSTRWNITEVIWSMKDIIRLYYYEFIWVCFSEFLKYFFGNCDVSGCRQWSKGVVLGLKLTVIVQIVDW